MKKTIYLDFDGTVVDIFDRYFGILQDFLIKRHNTSIAFQRFIELKKTGIKDHQIVEMCCNHKINIEEYILHKRDLLESEKWLSTDKVIGYPKITYERLKSNYYNICLLTQRRYSELLYKQIKTLRLEDSFDDIVVVKPLEGANVKKEYLKDKIVLGDIIIGDSPVEMECAAHLGIGGYFVETGLWGRQFATKNSIVCESYDKAAKKICLIK